MSVYRTEEEQLEAIKKWWKQYSSVITMVFSVVLLSVAGVRYWNWHQEKMIHQASAAYEHLMVAVSDHDNKRVKSYANQLIHEYSRTVYADVAHLTLAKIYIAKDHFKKAAGELQQVIAESSMPALKQVARIRLARIRAATQSFDEALKGLETVDDVAYLPVINELKGDIYAATGEFQKAVGAYRLAITDVRDRGMGNLFLEMKTNELAALTQSRTHDNVTPQEA